MGIVYLAAKPDGSQVAVKTIKPQGDTSSKQVKRFLREAEILQRLDHPHIVAYHDMGETEGLLYFVMEYVHGKDVHRLVQEFQQLAVKPAVQIMCQALKALDYAHRQGFVHRDVKPANLLLEKTALGNSVRLADFGLARVYQSSKLSGLTATGEIGGTFCFMPPEQITNFRDVNPLSDQFAAAASLYRMLTGKYIHDFDSSRVKPVVLILENDAVPISDRGVKLPNGLEEVIHRGLERNPRKRFRDAAAFAAALEEFA
jgi:serine/threonine-protein kinase